MSPSSDTPSSSPAHSRMTRVRSSMVKRTVFPFLVFSRVLVLSRRGAHHHGSVETAHPAGEHERGAHRCAARLAEHEVDLVPTADPFDVDGRRDDAVADGEQGG